MTAIFRANPENICQPVHSFGVSGCWWAPNVTEKPDLNIILELLFTEKGIGLNSYRHNMPAGESVPGMDPWRYTSWLDTNGGYSASRDKAFPVLERVANLGVSTISLFYNSPPNHMTISGFASGRAFGLSNLQTGKIPEFAAYAAEAAMAVSNAGINVKYLSPVNEPVWGWHRNYQEGCHYSPEEAYAVCKATSERLKENGSGIKLSMPDSARWFDPEYTVRMLDMLSRDKELLPHVDHFSAHSYNSTPEDKRLLREFMDSGKIDLPLYQSEWAEMKPSRHMGMDGALMLARCVHEDLTILSVQAWDYWLGVSRSSSTDGLIYIPGGNEAGYQCSKRFWTLGNYSRFAAGTLRIDVDCEGIPVPLYCSAYLNRKNSSITFVAVNESANEQRVCFEGGSGIGVAYETSEGRNLELVAHPKAGEGFVLAPRSVTSLVFPL